MSGALDHRTGPYAALLLRVALGVLFIVHLYWKFAVLDGGFPHWWANFATNGYPWFVPYYVISAEFVGALFLIPGIYTRWAALYAVPMMFGAAHYWLVRKGFYFSAAGAELPIVWGAMLILQSLLGDGLWAARASTFTLSKLFRLL
jgi:putative oxidoreductase